MASQIAVKLDRSNSGVSAAWVRKVVKTTLKKEKAGSQTVGVWITDNRNIRRINRKFLKHDTATDVISFGFGPEAVKTGAPLLGDLVVSSQMARQVSRELKIPFQEELARYLAHGTLHLLGYNDKAPRDQKKMYRRQEEILKQIL